MKKIAIFLLTAALAGVCLTGCGGDAGEGQKYGDADEVSSRVSSSTKSKKKEVTKLDDVKIQGTSGVIVDDGKNYFAIDSMEMTEEGLIIRYRGESDPSVKTNQRGQFEADYRSFSLNGKPLSTVTSRSLEGAEHRFWVDASSVYIDGKDTVCEIVIDKNTLSQLEITELPTLEADIRIGYYEEGWGMHASVEVRFTVTP